MKKLLSIFLVIFVAFATWFYFFKYNRDLKLYQQLPEINLPKIFPSETPKPGSLAQAKTLETNYHVFQTFNNCGPASLSMALRFYGMVVSQKELGDDLRPYQIASGDNDDKSVTLQEVADKSREYGLTPFRRPNGTPEILKKFIANDIPVITRTWTKPNEDIGHFRVVKGYDDARGVFIQDDSLQGKNLKYTYEDFDVIWKKFNYEYLVLVPKEKEGLAEEILGEDASEKASWKKAVENARKELLKDSGDVYARFNLSVALYNAGDLRGSVQEFEKVESQISFRTLWYQIEPIQAYYELGDYERVFSITDNILNNGNRAFSELYVIRGNIYKKQGNTEAAKSEFEKAVLYNKNLKSAQDGLKSVS